MENNALIKRIFVMYVYAFLAACVGEKLPKPGDFVSVYENFTSAVYVIELVDEGTQPENLVISLAGEDAEKFFYDRHTRSLRFIDPPNFEQPKDRDRDNIYKVEISFGDSLDLNSAIVVDIAVEDLPALYQSYRDTSNYGRVIFPINGSILKVEDGAPFPVVVELTQPHLSPPEQLKPLNTNAVWRVNTPVSAVIQSAWHVSRENYSLNVQDVNQEIYEIELLLKRESTDETISLSATPEKNQWKGASYSSDFNPFITYTKDKAFSQKVDGSIVELDIPLNTGEQIDYIFNNKAKDLSSHSRKDTDSREQIILLLSQENNGMFERRIVAFDLDNNSSVTLLENFQYRPMLRKINPSHLRMLQISDSELILDFFDEASCRNESEALPLDLTRVIVANLDPQTAKASTYSSGHIGCKEKRIAFNLSGGLPVHSLYPFSEHLSFYFSKYYDDGLIIANPVVPLYPQPHSFAVSLSRESPYLDIRVESGPDTFSPNYSIFLDANSVDNASSTREFSTFLPDDSDFQIQLADEKLYASNYPKGGGEFQLPMTGIDITHYTLNAKFRILNFVGLLEESGQAISGSLDLRTGTVSYFSAEYND